MVGEMETTTVTLVVNGESLPIAPGKNVLDLLEQLGLDGARVAVEADGRIVRREAWASYELREGTRMEIVQFVGGG